MTCTEHEHIIPNFTPTSEKNNLFQFIDLANVKVLNAIMKPLGTSVSDFLALSTENNNSTLSIESDCDNQLLIVIPFTNPVNLFSVLLETKNSEGTLKHLNFYRNLNDSFDNFSSIAARNPDQSTEIIHFSDSIPEYPLDRAKLFKNCTSLHIFLPDNMEEDEDLVTKVSYIEIRGETSKKNEINGLDVTLSSKVFLKNAKFESIANPKDHKKFESGKSALMEL
ncbi:hypothetical protein QEN19_002200 [Hanseniaspora menglaensis]